MLLYLLLALCLLWQGALTALLLLRRPAADSAPDELAQKRERLLTEGLESLLSYSLETAMREGEK